MPDITAPILRPVDMAPQPEYRSNKVISDFFDSSMATIASSIGWFDLVSLEIDDLLLSVLDCSKLSK